MLRCYSNPNLYLKPLLLFFFLQVKKEKQLKIEQEKERNVDKEKERLVLAYARSMRDPALII